MHLVGVSVCLETSDGRLTDDATYSGGYQIDELLVRGVFRLDEYCRAVDNGVYSF